MAKTEQTNEMAVLYEKHGMTLEQIGKEYGVSKQTVSQRFAALKFALPAREPKIVSQINREKLEYLYTKEKLSIEQIAGKFGTTPYKIYQALEFYKIARRPSIKLNGKHKDILKALATGETAQIECLGKTPHVILHRAAKRLGIKISMKKLGEGKFAVTRIS